MASSDDDFLQAVLDILLPGLECWVGVICLAMDNESPEVKCNDGNVKTADFSIQTCSRGFFAQAVA